MFVDLHIAMNTPAADEAMPSLPAALSKFNDSIRRLSDTMYLDVNEPQEIADALMCWARLPLGNRTLGRYAHYKEVYGLEDLSEDGIVEIFVSDSPKGVSNRHKALVIQRDCDYCDHVSGMQVADYKLLRERDLDWQITQCRQLIVSERIAPILRRWGCSLRETLTTGYYQLFPLQEFVLDVDRFPMRRASWACKACRRRMIYREHLECLEPSRQEEAPAFWVLRNSPITVVSQKVSDINVARSCELPNLTMAERPVFARDSNNTPASLYNRFCDVDRLFIAQAGLVRELLSAGASGLAFRPWIDDGVSAFNYGPKYAEKAQLNSQLAGCRLMLCPIGSADR